jgi:hypothetical protein
MPTSISMTVRVEPKDMKNSKDEPSWFPFEWFLDPEDNHTDKLQVLDTNSVMRNHNKNCKLQVEKPVVEKIANAEMLDHELGLKATDKVTKILFPHI